ncbi:MAG: hypothetical protein E7224_04695 [Clostridiales bacterium]|nr:hypothetical protein [Clostridiales bacterium]
MRKKRRRGPQKGKAAAALFVCFALVGAGLAVVTQDAAVSPEVSPGEETSLAASSDTLTFLPEGTSSQMVSRGGSGYSRDPESLSAANPFLENMIKMALPGVGAAEIPEPPSSGAVSEPKPEPELPVQGAGPVEKEPAPVIKEPEIPQVAVVDSQGSKDPLVLIYHTHATESYQPYEEGNFHIVSEEGTVRDAGNILAAALEAKGIPVLHDKTLHDNPSYNQSYSRSLDTLNGLLAKYPSITTVIDLHRDAAAYSGNNPRTFTAPDGTVAAQYSLVVGTGNDNLEQLLDFAARINGKAEEMYPGFARDIIRKDYKFNQYKKDQYILLELGNNQNTIEQVRASAAYFAEVMAAVLKGTE